MFNMYLLSFEHEQCITGFVIYIFFTNFLTACCITADKLAVKHLDCMEQILIFEVRIEASRPSNVIVTN